MRYLGSREVDHGTWDGSRALHPMESEKNNIS